MRRAWEGTKALIISLGMVSIVVALFFGFIASQPASADNHDDVLPTVTVTITDVATETPTSFVTNEVTVTTTAPAPEPSTITTTATVPGPTETQTVTAPPNTGSCNDISGVKKGNTITLDACGMIIEADVNELANGTLDFGGIVTIPPVTLPPVTAPPVTLPPVTVPGPVRTRTIRPDPITRTVTVPVPGPTTTRTVRSEQQPPVVFREVTETATVRVPGPTATVTVTEQGRQPVPPRATIEPRIEPGGEIRTEVRTERETIIRNVLLGTLVSLVLAALGALALFLGYILGQRDAKKNEDGFIEGVLDATKIRRR